MHNIETFAPTILPTIDFADLSTVTGGSDFNQALQDLQATANAVSEMNGALQVNQARRSVTAKAIDSMNEAVVIQGSRARA
jgi:hypothetical protein